MATNQETSNLSMPDKVRVLEERLKQMEELMGGMNYNMQRIAQTEMQDRIRLIPQAETQMGVYTALCIDTIDVWKQNRIRFYTPLFHDPDMPIKSLPWAWPVSPFGGFDDSGVTWVPPAGSTVMIVFEGGARQSPYYIGTTWSRNRGPAGQHTFGVNVEEYYNVWEGHRRGYLVGPDNESQVFPPWNTENYNGFDLNSIVDFDNNPEAQKRITYPNIYGFKTPEKHMLKMVDGDPKCNRRWKRIELMSGCGNWLMMKDDHLHFAGQWAHPTCGGGPDGDVSCVEGVGTPSQAEDVTRTQGQVGQPDVPPDPPDITGQEGAPDYSQIDLQLSIQEASLTNDDPIIMGPKEETSCEGETSNSKIIGGHPRTPGGSCYDEPTKYADSQVGANPFFKQEQECRPYKAMGIGGNKCELPQSGIQIMSISGHTIIMDDSVEEPQGEPTWERSLMPFDPGCNGKYLGRMIMRSATGHEITFDDSESCPGIRGPTNGIRFQTASGNLVQLCEDTVCADPCDSEDESAGQCPPNHAGENRGVLLQSTSKHMIQLCDNGNKQCAPCRACGVPPEAKADQAFIMIRSGYGLEMQFADDDDQEETRQQYIQIFCPQKDNEDRGPHIMRFQEAPSGPGQIFLRAGGDYIVSTYDYLIEIVGDKDENPSDKMEIISRDKIVDVEEDYINIAQLHVFIADEVIMLLAGKDCPEPDGTMGPCPAPVIVYANGCLTISDRVYATASQDAEPASIFMLDPFCSWGKGNGGNGGGNGGGGGGGA